MTGDIESQQYWLFAIDAKRAVGKHAILLSGGKTSSWNKIMSNGKFSHLPTISPPDKKEPSKTTTPTVTPKAKINPKYPYSEIVAKVTSSGNH